jgi:hypothetical protein
MNKKLFVKFEDSLHLIEEADIILIRGTSLFSKIVKKAGEGVYSHVGLATWHNGKRLTKDNSPLLEITEFKEWRGGRTVNLYTAYYNHIKNKNIDVYRISTPYYRLKFDFLIKKVSKYEIDFNGKRITNYMRKLTGLPYGWSRIWYIAKRKLFGFRLFNNDEQFSNDDINDIYPVCSTAVASAYNEFGFDLMPNKSNLYMEPNDLSRSASLNYLFTLTT